MTLGKDEPTIRKDEKNFISRTSGIYVKAGNTTYFNLGTEWDTITEMYNLDAVGKGLRRQMLNWQMS